MEMLFYHRCESDLATHKYLIPNRGVSKTGIGKTKQTNKKKNTTHNSLPNAVIAVTEFGIFVDVQQCASTKYFVDSPFYVSWLISEKSKKQICVLCQGKCCHEISFVKFGST